MSKLLINKLFALLRVIGASYSEKELSGFTKAKISEFKSLYNEMNKRGIMYARELRQLSAECGWDLEQLIAEILRYPEVIPRVRKPNGELYFRIQDPIPPRINSEDLLVLDAFYNEVKNIFLELDLFEEWIEFNRLFHEEGNLLAAHAYANQVASEKSLTIDRNIDEAFWRTVW